jgi:hypothetical protein
MRSAPTEQDHPDRAVRPNSKGRHVVKSQMSNLVGMFLVLDSTDHEHIELAISPPQLATVTSFSSTKPKTRRNDRCRQWSCTHSMSSMGPARTVGRNSPTFSRPAQI